MNPKLLLAMAIAEAIIIAIGLLLSIVVFPAEGGGPNLMILLPVIFGSSAIVSGVVLTQVLKNRSGT
jgi:hypothetical protein